MAEKNTEIMTVEEVAEFLRVSPRTVYEWANKGTIPCGKLGSVWRFRRSEIEKWVNSSLQTPRPADKTSTMAQVLTPQRVIIEKSATKTEALNALIDRLAACPEISDRNDLAEKIFQREKLMSTGIGLGVGVPHVRLNSVTSPVMAVGVYHDGVTDYDSLDGKPVQVVFMVAAGVDQHEQHLRLLAKIGDMMKNDERLQELLAAETPDDVYRILVSASEGGN